MNARTVPWLAFGAVLAAMASFVLATVGEVPERVATHFGRHGVPDGWMTRDGYTLYMLAFAVGFPILVVALIAVAPRLFPAWTNVPNRKYWLAPERRAEATAFLGRHACWLGCVMSLTAGAMHALLLRAGRLDPPRLETSLFLAILGISLACVAAWIVALHRRFRRPPT